jgi:hypothetical protein
LVKCVNEIPKLDNLAKHETANLSVFGAGITMQVQTQDTDTRARGMLAGAGMSKDEVELRAWLEQLRVDPKHALSLRGQGLTLTSLARLSSDEVTSLGLPVGPLVRIRKAVELGLCEFQQRFPPPVPRKDVSRDPQASPQDLTNQPSTATPPPAANDAPWGKPKSTAPPPGMPSR